MANLNAIDQKENKIRVRTVRGYLSCAQKWAGAMLQDKPKLFGFIIENEEELRILGVFCRYSQGTMDTETKFSYQNAIRETNERNNKAGMFSMSLLFISRIISDLSIYNRFIINMHGFGGITWEKLGVLLGIITPYWPF